MDKDTFYFKHDANAMSDLKIKALRRSFGWEGYGWFWFLVETLRSEADYSLGYTDFVFESLSEDMKCEPTKVKDFIDHCIRCGLFKKDGEKFFSPRLTRDMQQFTDAKEKMRFGGLKSAAKRNQSTTFQPPSNHLVTTFQQEEKSKEEKTSSPTPSKIDGDDVLVKYYESQTGHSVAPGIAEALKDLAAKYGEGKVRDSIRVALLAEARNPVKYMAKTLENTPRDSARRGNGNGGHPNLSVREVVVGAAR
jgi:hypothetical protein